MINKLINYGLEKKLIKARDICYVNNRISHLLDMEQKDFYLEKNNIHVQEILDELTKDEYLQALIMDVFMPLPSEFEKKFHLAKDPLGWYYQEMKNVNYIKTKAISKNIKFNSFSKYGELEVTINFSKPEKDPKEIAKLKKISINTEYPKCQLCVENEGYYGRLNWNDRSNHRMIKLDVGHSNWYLQFSPYQYYNHHAILLSETHEDMKMDENTFRNLFDFVDLYPNYFIGSNAELPIIGGSILNHAHYQCGEYKFPINNASTVKSYRVNNVECSILDWPLSTIKLTSKDRRQVIEVASTLLEEWRNYTNEESGIFAHTDAMHNSITPILFMNNGYYELFIVLRNNLTTEEYPDGVFHPHEDKHHIKKENIGLIEVMGLAILPPRLGQLYDDVVGSYYLNGKLVDSIAKLEEEIGNTFEAVLEDCGVFFNYPDEFSRFIEKALNLK